MDELTSQVTVMHDLLKEIHRLPNLVYILKADSQNVRKSVLDYLSLEADDHDKSAAEILAGMSNSL